MRTPHDLGIELRTRNFHLRQYFVARFDVGPMTSATDRSQVPTRPTRAFVVCSA